MATTTTVNTVTAEENDAHINDKERCWQCAGTQTKWAQG
jgi:hypothetical protein